MSRAEVRKELGKQGRLDEIARRRGIVPDVAARAVAGGSDAASSADPMASPASFTKSFESRGESRRSTLRKSHPLDVHHRTNGADAEACAISRLVVSRRGVASGGNEKWINPPSRVFRTGGSATRSTSPPSRAFLFFC